MIGKNNNKGKVGKELKTLSGTITKKTYTVTLPSGIAYNNLICILFDKSPGSSDVYHAYEFGFYDFIQETGNYAYYSTYSGDYGSANVYLSSYSNNVLTFYFSSQFWFYTSGSGPLKYTLYYFG